MLVIAACIVLVAVGALLVARWGGLRSEPRARAPLGWWLGYGTVALAAGLTAGVLAAGAGGRLVMRLLAATSPAAEGSVTEAGEIVGEITAGGTVAFVIFTGLAAGSLSAALYALVRPALPTGRTGGLILGLLLLLVAGATIDPLRAENPDFFIVGPSWLAVLAFTVLALFHGLVVTAVGARLDREVALAGRPLALARAGLTVVVLVALPGFAAAVGDIL